ncbi:CPBP family intramembrane metalloprotease [Bacillus sp. HMF5848]|uniref:CPBP family intramembrane glutamic endopeptidase n=1 Tax=Bacillus sp. HMF5848 TaxID=2495421 RepID=UPI000F77B09D|nr:CPBP family intramembrane glutamic endopeptidase [Bacillus sp. HMF5848]RSK29147.1 CPBP family intramembrane metalloprotease [Bacillus sp. HMF5848]
MKKLQLFFKNHPFIFAFFVLIMSRIAGLVTVSLIQMVRPDWTIASELGWLLMVIYAGTVVSLVYWADVADEIGLRKPTSKKEWLYYIPFLSIPLFILSINGVSSWGFTQNMLLLMAAIGVAVNEEVLFRGLLLRGFMKWGPWVAIFVPSLLFALVHSTNVFVGGDPTFAVFQTIWTLAAGVLLSAIRLRANSLYPVILLHILIDGVEYFSTGEFGVHSEAFPIITLALFSALNAILAIYAVILFYKKQYHKNQAVAENTNVI